MSDKPHRAVPRAKNTFELAREPLAVIRAYRKTGGAIVTIARDGRGPHRHHISLRRYAALREWTITHASRRWRTSGWWGRSSIAVSLWSAL